MVEGHSVHRIAISHGKRLVGRSFKAASPNGRFSDGASLINGREFSRIEAIGKNLFAFFSAVGVPDVVMHVHFGMSGRWSVADTARAREPTATTRLTLEGHGMVSHLSAMTVDHGGLELFDAKRRTLGHDPLRADADPDALWVKVSTSSKTIGALLMDQTAFAGVGNIFRAEILFVARVHPELKGKHLTRQQFDSIWAASVRLMHRAFTLGSILTVFPEEAAAVGRPGLRRWIYNSGQCGRCGGPVASWAVQSRTCYACNSCQPLDPAAQDVAMPAGAGVPTLFNSLCAGESLEERLRQPQKLRVAELRTALEAANLPTAGLKAELVSRLTAHHQAAQGDHLHAPARGGSSPQCGSSSPAGGSSSPPVAAGAMRSARAAAAEKAAAKESRAVEHIAEDEDLDDGAPEWIGLPKGSAVPAIRPAIRPAIKPAVMPAGRPGTPPSDGDNGEPLHDEMEDDMHAAILHSDVQAAILHSIQAAGSSTLASGGLSSPAPTAARKRGAPADADTGSTPDAQGKRVGQLSTITAGTTCVVVGLHSRADLNGRQATVQSRDVKRGRWNVYVDGELKKLSLREENLTLQTYLDGGEGEGAVVGAVKTKRSKRNAR